MPFLAMLPVALVLYPALCYYTLRRLGRTAPNYLGVHIPLPMGVSILLGSLTLLFALFRMQPALKPGLMLWIEASGSFGCLGLLDDLLGTSANRGLKGHLMALLRKRKLTTGLIKAVGGLCVGVHIGFVLHPNSAFAAVLCGTVIALFANAMNLLDLRPGRALGVYLVLCISLFSTQALPQSPAILHTNLTAPLACVALPALSVWLMDRRALVMMGDTGSNLIGASLGLAVAVLPSTPVHLIALMMLIAMHLAAERWSLTKIIEQNHVLRWLDKLTGVRG